jgi:hypothetical protein
MENGELKYKLIFQMEKEAKAFYMILLKKKNIYSYQSAKVTNVWRNVIFGP